MGTIKFSVAHVLNSFWNQAFYINLVIGALFSPVYIFLLPSIGLQKEIPLTQRLKRNIDWLGNIVFTGTMCCFIMAITFGGTLFTWSSASEIVLWVMAGVLLIVFCLTQSFHPFVDSKNKLYPTMFLARPTLMMLQVAIFMSSVSLLVSLLSEELPIQNRFLKENIRYLHTTYLFYSNLQKLFSEPQSGYIY